MVHVTSLSDLSISLPEDVRSQLASQYLGLYHTADDPEKAASAHLDRILDRMKASPSVTFCRVNEIRATKNEIISGLESVVDRWERNREGSSDGEGRDGDVMSHRVVRAHDVFPDCVVVVSEQNGKASPPHVSEERGPPISDEGAAVGEDRLDNMSATMRTERLERGWPDTHRALICSRFCGEAVLRGSDIFVRGIICADTGIRKNDLVAVYADVNIKETPVSRGITLLNYSGLNYNNRCVFLGIGKACCNRAEMFNLPSGLGVDMSFASSAGHRHLPLNGILEGKMFLQNLPSALVAHALGPQRGETILDMCSAPGGKTNHVASLVRNDALIVACDKSRRKILSAKESFDKMGATCIVPLALDSTRMVINDGSAPRSVKEIISSAVPSPKDGILHIKSFHPESFDRIILDPPCSALGLRPKLCIQMELHDLLKIAIFQKKFVKNAVALLKPGGIMTYSTCTISAIENETMVRFILDEYSCMKLVNIDQKVGLPGLPGMGLSDEERGMVRRFDPCDEADTMGFFVAKFTKC